MLKLLFIVYLLITLPISSFAVDQVSENEQIERIASRIHAHFTIKNERTAFQEASQAIAVFPHSEILLGCYIQAAARLGSENRMLDAWKEYIRMFPEQDLNRNLIEEMAWGVLNKAANSSSLIMRQMALLAALLTNDVKGINLLNKGLEDSNYAIRAQAVELCGRLPDAKLVNCIKDLFRTEKTWQVRQNLIAAIGTMKIHDLKPELKKIVASDNCLAEERALAIKAVLDLSDHIEREELLKLAESNRAGLRLLACEAISYFQSSRDLDQLYLLSADFNSDVRLAALQAIGLLRPQNNDLKVLNIARAGVRDPNFRVAVTAAWLLTLYAPQEGMERFALFLNSPQRDRGILAAGALKATGQYGAPLSLKLFESHPDPYVKLNLALHLAGRRLVSEKVCRVFQEIIENDKSKWDKIEVGIFEIVAAKQIFPEIESESPEMQDQLIRLEILNLLAILKSGNAHSAIRQFLTERTWGISGAAAILLLTEGDESAIESVESLLNDPQPKVRLQAALVLSLWSQEESAIRVLEQNYVNGTQEQKCRILEAIARIGSMKSAPFLIEALHDPSQTIRLIAALGLIQCLNH